MPSYYSVDPNVDFMKTDEVNNTHIKLGSNIMLPNSVAYFILSNIENMSMQEIALKI